MYNNVSCLWQKHRHNPKIITSDWSVYILPEQHKPAPNYQDEVHTKIAHYLTLYTQWEGSHTRTTSHMGMITNGMAEEHSHSIQAEFYDFLTKHGNYTRIFVGDTFGQSVAKLMTHLTVYGEFSSIPNLGKTSPPPLPPAQCWPDTKWP